MILVESLDSFIKFSTSPMRTELQNFGAKRVLLFLINDRIIEKKSWYGFTISATFVYSSCYNPSSLHLPVNRMFYQLQGIFIFPHSVHTHTWQQGDLHAAVILGGFCFAARNFLQFWGKKQLKQNDLKRCKIKSNLVLICIKNKN